MYSVLQLSFSHNKMKLIWTENTMKTTIIKGSIIVKISFHPKYKNKKKEKRNINEYPEEYKTKVYILFHLFYSFELN